MLAGFALPPLLQLSRVPALRVLRRDMGPPPLIVLLAFGPAVLTVAALVYWVVRDPMLFLGFTGGPGGFLLVLAGAGAALVHFAGRLRGAVGVAWRYGLANLRRRRAESLVQIVAFGVGFMVLLLLANVRNDLNEDWRQSLPVDVPNYFFVNIPPQDRAAFLAFLAGPRRADFARPADDPRTADADQRTSRRGNDFCEPGRRGLRVPRAEPDVVAGSSAPTTASWPADGGAQRDFGKPLVSLATEFQESLGVKLGDRLTFDVAGESFTATHRQHPQGQVGQLSAQFLHRVRAGHAR